ncbi:MAG: dihydroorotase [Proteobacteria bacterium]|nr:dihydroorotase [Pseudomonadota bacterium]
MAIQIRGGRILDPSRGFDEIGSIFISGERIAESCPQEDSLHVIDATGLWVVPGLIDAHVHLREPGQEHKENIATGLQAAAAGGFTAVLAMPNTSPANDSPEITRMMIARARALGGTRIYPVAAVTKGRRGQHLADLAELKAAGAVAFSDDGSAVVADALMEEALRTCGRLGVPLSQHAEDPGLSKDGVIHDGQVSRELGVPGVPASSEERIVARDIALVETTAAHLHVSHISTKEAVAHVRDAKKRGLSVTAEVTPHHLHLTDAAVRETGTQAKVNPPLRTAEDVASCREALADGTIDILATDHAPHTSTDKEGGLMSAAFGMVGLEIAVPLVLSLVEERILSPMRMIDAMSTAPAQIFGLPGGSLRPGSIADLTLINPRTSHKIDSNMFKSKGRNTPFDGWQVVGKIAATYIRGKEIYKASR